MSFDYQLEATQLASEALERRELPQDDRARRLLAIEKAGGSAVQASSMLMLMTLGAGNGDEVTLRAEGEGAEESVNALAALLEKDLDAEA